MTKEEEAIWWVNHLFEIRKEEHFNKGMMEDAKEVEQAQHLVISALSAEKQVTSKLKNPCDSLLTEDSEDAKEQKSKLKGKSADICIIDEPIVEHDREWIIGCIKHDGFIKTDRFDKANQIILEALEPSGDLISRAELRKAFCKINDLRTLSLGKVGEIIDSVPSADRPTEILDDRTLVVKVQNAKEVGRVWVQDADKNVHIGGGFYYHENSADRPMVDRDYLVNLIQESVYDGEACARLLDIVDRPMGEWQDIEDGTLYVCSNCKWGAKHEYPYCPSCGAKMKGGKE